MRVLQAAALGVLAVSGGGGLVVMTAYYNEMEPFAAAWLRELIKAGLIAPGDVDERSIEDVTPNDLLGYTQCHFFAGIGVWSYALRSAGWSDDRRVWTGSCPCQPFSQAGEGNGFADERHLWPSFYWLIAQCQPAIVFGEQVASKAAEQWIDLVQSDLEALGYAFGCIPFPAASVGAPHIRDRNYWTACKPADAKRNQQPRQEPCGGQAGRVGWIIEPVSWDTPWQSSLAKFRALDDGHPRCLGGTDAARNAIVAPQAQAFIESVMECL